MFTNDRGCIVMVFSLILNCWCSLKVAKVFGYFLARHFQPVPSRLECVLSLGPLSTVSFFLSNSVPYSKSLV